MGYTVFSSGGATFGTDAQARADIDLITGVAGGTLAPGASILIDGFIWSNDTAAPVLLPTPLDEANLTATTLTKGVQAGSSSGGVRIGEATTIAGFPTTRPDLSAIKDGDWAKLTDIDGVNQIGNYVFNAGVATFSTLDLQGDQKPLITRRVTADTIITLAEVSAANGHFGLGIDTKAQEVTVTIEAGMPDDTELFIVAEKGDQSAFIVPTPPETIDGDIQGLFVNGLGAFILKKQTLEFCLEIIGKVKLHDDVQPDLADNGVVYDYFLLTTEQIIGSDAVFNVTTQTNQVIWSVDGVETKTNSFVFPGTGTAQLIKAWVPIGQGIDFDSRNSAITSMDSRRINAGFTKLFMRGSNMNFDDKAIFGTELEINVFNTSGVLTGNINAPHLQFLQVNNTNSVFDDQLSIDSNNLVNIKAGVTQVTFTNDLFKFTPGIQEVLAGLTTTVFDDTITILADDLLVLNVQSTPSSFTNDLTLNAVNMTRLFIGNTNSPLITGDIVRNMIAPKTISLKDLNLPSSAVDDVLIACADKLPVLTELILDGNNAPRTSLSDAAFALLDAAITHNSLFFKVNI